jgi:hypothetical protein
MSTAYRTLRHIEAWAEAALCEISTITHEGIRVRVWLDRIGKAANRELAKCPIMQMKDAPAKGCPACAEALRKWNAREDRMARRGNFGIVPLPRTCKAHRPTPNQPKP